MTTKRSRIVCALLATAAAGCGLPIPTDGATNCGRNVYLEVGVSDLTCAQARQYVELGEEEVGVNLSRLTVEFMAGEDLRELGQPNAWGRWQPGTIAVTSFVAISVVHEALHERWGSGHCNWSTRFVPLFNSIGVPGSFDDECANVHCTSTTFWTDAAGQGRGAGYVCKPL